MRRINIVAWDNKGGLSRDIDIVANVLRTAGYKIMYNGYTRRDFLSHFENRFLIAIKKRCPIVLNRAFDRQPYDMNLFLEYSSPRDIPLASINCLIPNPEWFHEINYHCLAQIDWVLCKTKSAQDIFNKMGCKTKFIGFSSLDRFDRTGSKERSNTFFHLAGASQEKGTNALLDLWLRHPEWPCLTIVQRSPYRTKDEVEAVEAINIQHIIGYLSDSVLRKYQNRNKIHLCPSQAEGFGHTIVEAMSCGALTLTTDAPPMNELIKPSRGILVKYYNSEPMRIGFQYYVDPLDLERKIIEIIGMDNASKDYIANNARYWYEENHKSFCVRFAEVLKEIIDR